MQMEIRSFREFWPYYIGEHRNPVGRGLHYVGSTLALACLATAIVQLRPQMLLLGLVLGYGPAWFAHFFIEHNRPATFKYPRWSLMADFKMLGLAVRGQMAAEVTRLYGSPNPPPDAPLRIPR